MCIYLTTVSIYMYTYIIHPHPHVSICLYISPQVNSSNITTYEDEQTFATTFTTTCGTDAQDMDIEGEDDGWCLDSSILWAAQAAQRGESDATTLQVTPVVTRVEEEGEE